MFDEDRILAGILRLADKGILASARSIAGRDAGLICAICTTRRLISRTYAERYVRAQLRV